MAVTKKENTARKLVAENRKARFNYEIQDVVEAGLMLRGTEVNQGGYRSALGAFELGAQLTEVVDLPVVDQAHLCT